MRAADDGREEDARQAHESCQEEECTMRFCLYQILEVFPIKKCSANCRLSCADTNSKSNLVNSRVAADDLMCMSTWHVLIGRPSEENLSRLTWQLLIGRPPIFSTKPPYIFRYSCNMALP
jgi:hypothetical protein